MKYWGVLLVSAVFEAIWATALGQTQGFSNLWATGVFVVSLILSMAGLGVALMGIPTGTAYAVWVGVGAGLTVDFAILAGSEPGSVLKIIFLGGIICPVAGLKL